MHLIVDGNNVVRAGPRTAGLTGEAFRAERERFIHELVRFREGTTHQITVVFDGRGLGSPLGSTQIVGGIRVTYSGQGREADDVIIQMVRAAARPQEILVVSSDRGIRDAVRAEGASVEGAMALRLRLAQRAPSLLAPAPGTDPHATAPTDSRSEVDLPTYVERYVKGYDDTEEQPRPTKGLAHRPKRGRGCQTLWSHRA